MPVTPAADAGHVARVRARLVRANPAYAAVFAGKPAPAAPATERAATGCPHRGADPVRLVECKTCGGRVQLKVYPCEVHGECTIGQRDRGVAGCCKGCPDNPTAPPATVAGRTPRPAGPVVVPDPPPVAAPRTSDRAVVAVAAGAEGQSLLRFSRPWLAAYAVRLGADFVVLDWPGVPGWGQSAKFAFGKVLEVYDRAVLIDTDTAADPHRCPDLFAVVPEGTVGIYDDLPGLLRHPKGAGLVEEYQRFREAAGLGRAGVPFYGNTGVVVADRRHAPLFAPPAVPVPPIHCGEQHWWVARLTDAAAPVFRLPAVCNYQWWERGQFADPPPPDAILHFSGIRPMRSAAARMEVMRGFAGRMTPAAPPAAPFAFPVPPASEWGIDLRHARWLHETLLSGRFRRVLEIGCLHGASTSAILAAAAAGAVDRVDLCEPAPTPELLAVIDRYALGDRVALHRCTSAELFGRGWGGWDLVFVDGDHSAGVVAVETAALLGAGARAVFAHDTAAEWMHERFGQPADHFAGPVRLVAALQAAGYRCLADQAARPGEATHRGMTFAARHPDDYAAGLAGYRRTCGPSA